MSKQEPEDFCNAEQLRNYQRNKTLIDFDSIPNELGELIYNKWVDKITQNDKSKILPYFMKHRLKELTEKLGDF